MYASELVSVVESVLELHLRVMKFAITRKIGMTRIFDEEGKHVPVTLLAVEDGIISRIKKADSRDGYDAIVVEVKASKENKKSKFYEFRVSDTSAYKIGSSLDIKDFTIDDAVSLMGTGKGKGFAGTIKRHGFHRGPVTHGSHNIRKPGSIGGGYPQRVVPGKKMAGRLGGLSVTIKQAKVAYTDEKSGIIAIRGSVPGPSRKIVKIIGNSSTD